MISTETFPQYAKTTHPEVIAAIEETARRYKEFIKQARQISEELTGNPHQAYMNGWKLEKVCMVGISASAAKNIELPGQWKKPDAGVVKPYKNNPITQRMNAITHKATSIPGRSNIYFAEHEQKMGTGAVFVHEGVAYSGLGFKPRSERENPSTYGWEEIKASEYHSAVEALKESGE